MRNLTTNLSVSQSNPRGHDDASFGLGLGLGLGLEERSKRRPLSTDATDATPTHDNPSPRARARARARARSLHLTGSLITLTFALSASIAHAQPAGDRKTAEELFADATKAFEAHNYDEACPKFAEVMHLQPGKVGAMMALGECYENASKIVAAHDIYASATEVAAKAGDTRAAKAKTKVTELEAKLSKLTIRVPDSLRNVSGLEVRRNGEIVPPTAFGQLVFVAPGDMEVTATAPNKKPFSSKQLLVAASGAQVDIALDDLNSATAGPSTLGPTTFVPVTPQPLGPTRDASTERSRGAVPTWAWVSGGVGVVATGMAIGFLVDQASAQKTANSECLKVGYDQTTCGSLAGRLHRDYGLWIGLGATGLVGLGAATIGIVTAKKSASTTAATHAHHARALDFVPAINVGPTGAFMTTHGTF